MNISMLNKQQLCAELGVSESTVRRLEQQGLPFTPVGVRSHRYDLDECKAWLREYFGGGPIAVARQRHEPESKAAKEFIEACRKVKLRVTPS
jgi:phage terminase Nu1 subunit (DNA packaging protein)